MSRRLPLITNACPASHSIQQAQRYKLRALWPQGPLSSLLLLANSRLSGCKTIAKFAKKSSDPSAPATPMWRPHSLGFARARHFSSRSSLQFFMLRPSAARRPVCSCSSVPDRGSLLLADSRCAVPMLAADSAYSAPEALRPVWSCPAAATRFVPTQRVFPAPTWSRRKMATQKTSPLAAGR